MSQPPANRFEKNPRAVIALLGSFVTLALCLGAFFLVKAVRDEAKRGVERYIVLRERRPSSDIPQTPADSLVAVADGLEKKAYPFRVDEDGYLLPSQMHQKPDRTIVFLGGSTTECMYMQEEERFPYLAGRRLEKDLGLKVNALNGGTAGNNTLHSVLALQGKVLQRRPQAVVLMECINDLNFLMIVDGYWTPHASRGIVFDKQYGWAKTFILKHLTGRKPLEASAADEFAAQRGREKMLDPAVLTSQYRKNIEHFVFLCRQHGIRPVLMTQFNRFTPEPETNLKRQMEAWGSLDYQAYLRAYTALQDTMRAVAAEQKVDLIDLDALVPKTKQYMYDVVHLNSAGAKLVADLVAERLKPLLARPGP